MLVKEIVHLTDGRDIVVNFTMEEYTYLLSFAVDAHLRSGAMALGTVAQEGHPEAEEVIDQDSILAVPKKDLH